MLLRLRPNPANQQHLCLTKCIKDHLIFLEEGWIDRSFVQIRFMPENALSTEVVDVEMVFLTATKVVKFGSLIGFIGRPRL
jgi:hypothetical protein